MAVPIILQLIFTAVLLNLCLSYFKCTTANSGCIAARGALESKAAFLAAQNCTPLDAAELQLIIARLDSTQDEKIRGDLDRDLHLKIAQISANPLILSVLNASAQITENMIVGIRSYLMQKNNDAPEIDSQHTRLVQAFFSNKSQQICACISPFLLVQ